MRMNLYTKISRKLDRKRRSNQIPLRSVMDLILKAMMKNGMKTKKTKMNQRNFNQLLFYNFLPNKVSSKIINHLFWLGMILDLLKMKVNFQNLMVKNNLMNRIKTKINNKMILLLLISIMMNLMITSIISIKRKKKMSKIFKRNNNHKDQLKKKLTKVEYMKKNKKDYIINKFNKDVKQK